jgi:hypothetical protein
MGSTNSEKNLGRLARVTSHALVDVKTNRWNPFSKLSAVLLDVTLMGFKIEFIENVSLAKNSELSFLIPLAPFEIYEQVTLKLRGHIKWFDPDSMRAGGVFVAPQAREEQILNQIIAFLRAKERTKVAASS